VTFNYDEKVDALEITLSGGVVARTEQLDEGTLVDLDEHGHVVAIEVIRPARSWPLDEALAMPGIEEADAEMLRAFWSAQTYPFSEHPNSAAESTTTSELVPA
jgi:uncharacterized protein YuzE